MQRKKILWQYSNLKSSSLAFEIDIYDSTTTIWGKSAISSEGKSKYFKVDYFQGHHIQATGDDLKEVDITTITHHTPRNAILTRSL